MKAPEKIRVHELLAKDLSVPSKEYHIVEYTRTDAFIERTCKYFEPILKEYAGFYIGTEILEHFKKYMKGE